MTMVKNYCTGNIKKYVFVYNPRYMDDTNKFPKAGLSY